MIGSDLKGDVLQGRISRFLLLNQGVSTVLEVVDHDLAIAIRGQGGVADSNGILTNRIGRTIGTVIHQGDGNHIAGRILQDELHVVQCRLGLRIHFSQLKSSRTVFKACICGSGFRVGICYGNGHFRMGSVHIIGLFHQLIVTFGDMGDQHLALGIRQEGIHTGCSHLVASILLLSAAERITGVVDELEGYICKGFTRELISFGQGKVQGPVLHAHLGRIACGVLGGNGKFLRFGGCKAGMLLFL